MTPYVINGLGQRVAKLSAPGSTTGTYFYYDEAGHLIGEYGTSGKVIEETVYLGDMPVAVLIGSSRYFIYADQLNAPRAATVRCRWPGHDARNGSGPVKPRTKYGAVSGTRMGPRRWRP